MARLPSDFNDRRSDDEPSATRIRSGPGPSTRGGSERASGGSTKTAQTRAGFFVTGGTGGLGTAVVERLSRDYDVVVLDRTRLDDITNEASVTKAFSEIGEHYALVHSVGGWTDGKVAETSLDTWERMLALNLTGAFLAIRESLKHLTRPGRIVAISSAASVRPFTPGSAAYTVTKSALNTLIETVATEYRGTGITANAILPDTMATPAMLRETKRPPDARAGGARR